MDGQSASVTVTPSVRIGTKTAEGRRFARQRKHSRRFAGSAQLGKSAAEKERRTRKQPLLAALCINTKPGTSKSIPHPKQVPAPHAGEVRHVREISRDTVSRPAYFSVRRALRRRCAPLCFRQKRRVRKAHSEPFTPRLHCSKRLNTAV